MPNYRLIALVVCSIMIANCAGSLRTSSDAPQIEMPAAALRPCTLHRIPDDPTLSDLEIGYAARGEDLIACDAARRLATSTHKAEHELETRQRGLDAGRGWRFWKMSVSGAAASHPATFSDSR